jgi:hypothetical protein
MEGSRAELKEASRFKTCFEAGGRTAEIIK